MNLPKGEIELGASSAELVFVFGGGGGVGEGGVCFFVGGGWWVEGFCCVGPFLRLGGGVGWKKRGTSQVAGTLETGVAKNAARVPIGPPNI